MNYADFESTLVPKDNERQNPNESYTDKYQKILLAVMATNQFWLMISLVSLLSYTQVKMLFTILLIVWLKKAIAAVIL